MSDRYVVSGVVLAVVLFVAAVVFIKMNSGPTYQTTIENGRVCVTAEDFWGHQVEKVCK